MMLIQASENLKGMVLPAIEKNWWVMVTLKGLCVATCYSVALQLLILFLCTNSARFSWDGIGV